MTVTLTAPISETDYRAHADLLQLPSDYTGDPVTTLLNQSWDSVSKLCNQPLSSTSNTDIYEFPSRYANYQPSGVVRITPRYLPVISITSISWSTSVVNNGWTATTLYDLLTDSVLSYDCPLSRGDNGLIRLIYTTGYATIPDSLKLACAQMFAHIYANGVFPTQAGTQVLSPWLTKDFWRIIDLYKRVR